MVKVAPYSELIRPL